MGKRVAIVSADPQNLSPPPTRSIRKRKRITYNSTSKALRLNVGNHSNWTEHENDDEDSSSNASIPALHNSQCQRNQSSKQANNSSILLQPTFLNASSDISTINESPKPVFTLRPSVVNGTILHDLTQKPWRLGRPIGKGNFGEIFLASDKISVPVTNENAKYVVKIEPHSNGPLFVEIHCLMNTAKQNAHCKDKTNIDEKKQSFQSPSGIPDYIASGSHYFSDARYRFLVLERFDRDLHSLIKNCRVKDKSVLTLAIQIVNVLERLHDNGYCHNDVKAQNLMISECKYKKLITKSSATTTTKIKCDYEEKQQTTDSGNSSEQEANYYEYEDNFLEKRNEYKRNNATNENIYEDENFDDDCVISLNSNSMDSYQTPVNKNKKARPRHPMVKFSGSNPVRSCRRQQRNSIYDEMVKSHYLRPAKRISYSEFFNEDGLSIKGKSSPDSIYVISSDDDYEEFVPHSTRRSRSDKKNITASGNHVVKRLTRRQEKILVTATNASQKIHIQPRASVELPVLVSEIKEERIFLIDFGLASKFMDNGIHRPFIMDQRRAHDGTLEFTSRDAHLGAHSRRSDLECLGFNLLFWSQGFLPWKEAAAQQQQEKVQSAKEYLMTDVREMLKQIYGCKVPQYLGEFLHRIGQLAYHERPNYTLYRRIFEKELEQLSHTVDQMKLDSKEIIRSCVRVKEEIENKNDALEAHNKSHNQHSGVWNMMNMSAVGTPFHESTISNRISPKNLRSKSGKKSMKTKKFSWAEILSQNPDQIARDRAEKEYIRGRNSIEAQPPTVRHYEGKPTYAILEIQQRLRCSGRLIPDAQASEETKKAADLYVVGDYEDKEDYEINDEEDIEEEEDEEPDENFNDEYGLAEYDNDEYEKVESDDSETSEQKSNGRKTRCTRNSYTSPNKKIVPKKRTTMLTPVGGRTRAATGRQKFLKTKSHKSIEKVTYKDQNIARNTRKVGSDSVVSNRGNHNNCSTPKYSKNKNVEDKNGVKPNERRTRRCLIKTDEPKDLCADESNSNYSPTMHSLINIWKKTNNETIFNRGNTIALRHLKK